MKQLIILIIIAGGITLLSSTSEYVEIPSTSIRMRVIAESNELEDQNEKLVIKSFLEEKIYDVIGNAEDAQSVDSLIEDKRSEIDDYVREKMQENNIDAEFVSSYGLNYFPEKEFKGVKYKAGNYKSYVLTLGEGKGENWWCVLYPPLCLIDEQTEEYEYHYLIKDAILKYN